MQGIGRGISGPINEIKPEKGTGFDQSFKKMEAAITLLQSAVARVSETFSPVLRSIPRGTDEKPKPTVAACAYDEMISHIEEKIHGVAEDLHFICDRSAV